QGQRRLPAAVLDGYAEIGNDRRGVRTTTAATAQGEAQGGERGNCATKLALQRGSVSASALRVDALGVNDGLVCSQAGDDVVGRGAFRWCGKVDACHRVRGRGRAGLSCCKPVTLPRTTVENAKALCFVRVGGTCRE